MSQEIQPTGSAPFDTIRHTDEKGEYSIARELMPMLEYEHWQDFDGAITRAIEDCAKAGRSIEENFEVFRRSPKNSGGRPPKDYRLTRFACRLVVMATRTSGQTAALARTYFSDQVDTAEEGNISEWRHRAVLALMAAGYSEDWAKRRIEDITARNELTHEWVVRGITEKEIPILTNDLHMRSFGLSISDHKEMKGFPITYKGKKLVYKGDLPPALTATELALNALASTVSKELHITNDSQGFTAISKDVRQAGEIVGRTRQDIEKAMGRPVVSSRNMLNEPDGGIWAQLPPIDEETEE